MVETLKAAQDALEQLLLEGDTDIVFNPRTKRYEDLQDTIAIPDDSDVDKPHALEASRRRVIVHRNPEDAIPYRPRPQLRSLSPLPYRPGPNLRRPEKSPKVVKEPTPIVYVSTPKDGEVRLYRGDRCAFMRSVGVQKSGKWKTRPKSSSKDEEGKVIIPSKYKCEEEAAQGQAWVENLIREGTRTDPKNTSTPSHWQGISQQIREKSLQFPPFSRGLPYPTDINFPPAEYSPAVDDIPRASMIEVAALEPAPTDDSCRPPSRLPSLPRILPPQASAQVTVQRSDRTETQNNSRDIVQSTNTPRDEAQAITTAHPIRRIPSLMDIKITPPESLPLPSAVARNPFAPRRPKHRSNKPGCWNCGLLSHSYSDCEEPRAKFCYRCGTPGKDTHTCPHCPERASLPPRSREGESMPDPLAALAHVEAAEAVQRESSPKQRTERAQSG